MLDIDADTSQLRRDLRDVIEQQLPFALSVGINRTARAAVDALRNEAETVFDRPTPFTLGAFTFQPSTKTAPVAVVWRKPSAASRDFLEVQATGGTRRQTGQEGALRGRAPVASPWVAAIPADGAALDAYGNWSAGERSRVFAQLRLFRDAAQWETERSKGRRIKRGGAEYFIPKHGLPPGVYRRAGRDAVPVLMFVGKVPQYRPRFMFEETVIQTWDGLISGNIAQALREALTMAR